MRGKTGITSVVAAMAIFMTVGLGAGTANASTTTPVIKIHHFSYIGDLQVSPGATIVVINVDGRKLGIPHSLTSNTGLFDTDPFVLGHRDIVAPLTPGTYRFHCEIHDTMKGALFVTG